LRRAGWFGWGGWLLALTMAGLIALSLIAPVNVGLDGAGAQTEEQVDDPAQAVAQADPVEVVKRVSPAVVTVINRQVVGDETADPQTAGAGTGFIIDEDGHIVTNAHVVAGGDEFVVLLANGEDREAELVGADEVSDLAVLEMAGDVPATVPLGDSDALQVGETVLAIGSPLGAFTNTVTQGIVSALGRSGDTLTSFGADAQLYTNLIQHDAAISPGNSGGPLFNLAGEVVGVNTLGLTDTGDGRIAQGLFFAIPSSTVARISSRLIEDGEVVYPFFGVGTIPITFDIAAQNDLPVDYGVYVEDVTEDSGAAEAGIRQGDIILSIDGQRIDQDNPFVEVLFNHEPGDTVEVEVQRGSRTVTVDVELGERD
jgi:2-alkenal reductase